MPNIRAEKVVVYAIDEVHLLEGDLISHLWGDSKERLNIPIMNEKKSPNLLRSFKFIKKLIIQEYKAENGDYTVDFLKKLIKANPGKKIIIFWEGVSYHRGETMQDFLEEVNGDLEEKDWRITCHLFPAYAPEENPIEAVWLSLKKLLRRCYRFCKNFTIVKCLFQLIVKFKLFTFPNLENYEHFSCLI